MNHKRRNCGSVAERELLVFRRLGTQQRGARAGNRNAGIALAAIGIAEEGALIAARILIDIARDRWLEPRRPLGARWPCRQFAGAAGFRLVLRPRLDLLAQSCLSVVWTKRQRHGAHWIVVRE